MGRPHYPAFALFQVTARRTATRVQERELSRAPRAGIADTGRRRNVRPRPDYQADHRWLQFYPPCPVAPPSCSHRAPSPACQRVLA